MQINRVGLIANFSHAVKPQDLTDYGTMTVISITLFAWTLDYYCANYHLTSLFFPAPSVLVLAMGIIIHCVQHGAKMLSRKPPNGYALVAVAFYGMTAGAIAININVIVWRQDCTRLLGALFAERLKIITATPIIRRILIFRDT